MRACARLVLAMVAACAAWSMPGAASGSASPANLGSMPTLAIASTAPGNCAAQWNREPVNGDAIVERGVALLERTIIEQGGPENITEESMPWLHAEAAPGLAWSCAEQMLGALRRAGFASVSLRLSGDPQAIGQRAHFLLLGFGAPPPSIIVRVGGGGRLLWNGEAVDLAGLRDRTGQGADWLPGDLLLVPSPDTTFGAVYEAVRAVRQGQGVPSFPGCRAGEPRPANAREPPEAEAADC